MTPVIPSFLLLPWQKLEPTSSDKLTEEDLSSVTSWLTAIPEFTEAEMKIAAQVFYLAEKKIHVLKPSGESAVVSRIKEALKGTILQIAENKARAISHSFGRMALEQLDELAFLLAETPKALFEELFLEEQKYHLCHLFRDYPEFLIEQIEGTAIGPDRAQARMDAIRYFFCLDDEIRVNHEYLLAKLPEKYSEQAEQFVLLFSELVQLEHWAVPMILVSYPELLNEPIIIPHKNAIAKSFIKELFTVSDFFLASENLDVIDSLLLELKIDFEQLLFCLFELLNSSVSHQKNILLFEQLLMRWSRLDNFMPLFEELFKHSEWVSLTIQHSPAIIGQRLSRAMNKDIVQAIPATARLELLPLLPPEVIVQTVHSLTADFKSTLLSEKIYFDEFEGPVEQMLKLIAEKWLSKVEYLDGIPSEWIIPSISYVFSFIPLKTLAVAASSVNLQTIIGQALRLLKPEQQAVITPLLPASLLLDVMIQTKEPLPLQCDFLQQATNEQKNAFLQYMSKQAMERPQNHPLFRRFNEKILQLNAFQKKIQSLPENDHERLKQEYRQLREEWILMEQIINSLLVKDDLILRRMNHVLCANHPPEELLKQFSDLIAIYKQQNQDLCRNMQAKRSILFEELVHLEEKKEKIPEQYRSPITDEFMHNPVYDPGTGNNPTCTYDFSDFKRNKLRSFVIGETFKEEQFMPNTEMQQEPDYKKWQKRLLENGQTTTATTINEDKNSIKSMKEEPTPLGKPSSST